MRLQSKYEIWRYHAVELQDWIFQYVNSCTLIARHQHFRPTSTLMMRAAGSSEMLCASLHNTVSQSNRL